jgi:ubiquinone/menaquinone biosynthesis C-methylase UbiE
MNQELATPVRRQDRFARWAPHYEDGEVLSRLLSELQVRAAARLHLHSSDQFLDVGCATGAAVRTAAATVELALGVDTSPVMLQHAQALAGRLPRAAFVLAEAQHLPFPPATFSAVLCSTALRHFPDATWALSEMVRVLEPSGRLVVADFLVLADRFSRRWWRRLQRSTAVAPDRAGPLQAVRGTGILVTEVIRCGTAIGPYAIVSAVKPELP